jgi:chromate transporter
VLQAVVLASSGLLLSATVALARNAVTNPVTVGIAVVTFLVLLLRKVETLWVIAGAAAVSLAFSFLFGQAH